MFGNSCRTSLVGSIFEIMATTLDLLFVTYVWQPQRSIRRHDGDYVPYDKRGRQYISQYPYYLNIHTFDQTSIVLCCQILKLHMESVKSGRINSHLNFIFLLTSLNIWPSKYHRKQGYPVVRFNITRDNANVCYNGHFIFIISNPSSPWHYLYMLLNITQWSVWRSELHVWFVMWRSWVRAPSKAPLFPWARNFTRIA